MSVSDEERERSNAASRYLVMQGAHLVRLAREAGAAGATRALLELSAPDVPGHVAIVVTMDAYDQPFTAAVEDVDEHHHLKASVDITEPVNDVLLAADRLAEQLREVVQQELSREPATAPPGEEEPELKPGPVLDTSRSGLV